MVRVWGRAEKRYGHAMVTVYGLRDPRDGSVFYVGATGGSLRGRLSRHRSTARFYGPVTALWRRVMGVVDSGRRPEIFPIEFVPDGVNEGLCEHGWIELFRHMGCPLTNDPLPKTLRSLLPEFRIV